MRRFRTPVLGIVIATVLAAACIGGAPPEEPPPPEPAPAAPTPIAPRVVKPPPPATPRPPAAAAAVPTTEPEARSLPVARPATTATAIPIREPTPIATAVVRAGSFPFWVRGSDGALVTFDKPPQRIVAYDSAAVEILFAIGEGHRLVGTHSFVSYPPEVVDIPRLGDAFNIDIEATVALDPDLVFIFFPTFLEKLQNAGLKVLYLKSLKDDFTKIADIVRMWGQITGTPSAAEVAAADFEARVERIRDTIAPYDSGLSVFQDEGDLWTPGPDTLVGEVFELLKLRNIAHDVSGYAQLGPELIVERNPDVIIASYGDTISGNPAFKDVHAVRNRRIYVPRSDALSVAGPRFVQGIEELARWVYPVLFK